MWEFRSWYRFDGLSLREAAQEMMDLAVEVGESPDKAYIEYRPLGDDSPSEFSVIDWVPTSGAEKIKKQAEQIPDLETDLVVTKSNSMEVKIDSDELCELKRKAGEADSLIEGAAKVPDLESQVLLLTARNDYLSSAVQGLESKIAGMVGVDLHSDHAAQYTRVRWLEHRIEKKDEKIRELEKENEQLVLRMAEYTVDNHARGERLNKIFDLAVGY